MDERISKRVAVDKQIECRVHGNTDRVLLYNLSVGGCMIEASTGFVSQGDIVVLKLSESHVVGGEVVWQHDVNAGIRFEESLHAAIVEFLGFKPTAQSFDHDWPRDRFGRLLPDLKPADRGLPHQL